MSKTSYNQKTNRLKPEVTKIFNDLEKWLDHCRFNLLPYNPADLYKSRAYKEFAGIYDKKQKDYKKDFRNKSR